MSGTNPNWSTPGVCGFAVMTEVIDGGGAWAGNEEEPGGGAEARPDGSSLRGRGLSLDDIVVVTCDVTVTTEDTLGREEWIKEGGWSFKGDQPIGCGIWNLWCYLTNGIGWSHAWGWWECLGRGRRAL